MASLLEVGMGGVSRESFPRALSCQRSQVLRDWPVVGVLPPLPAEKSLTEWEGPCQPLGEAVALLSILLPLLLGTPAGLHRAPAMSQLFGGGQQ